MTLPLARQLCALLEQTPVPVSEIVGLMAEAAWRGDPDDLSAIVDVARMHGMGENNVGVPALALLPAWGSEGIREVVRQITEGPHWVFAPSIACAIALGRKPDGRDVGGYAVQTDYNLAEASIESARRQLQSQALDCVGDTWRTSRLLYAMSNIAMSYDDDSRAQKLEVIASLFVDSRLVVNSRVLERFQELLSRTPLTEEDLHRYLV